MHEIRRTIRLRSSLAETWDFFSDPRNLSRITPEKLNFRIISDLPDRIYPGAIIRYKVSPLLSIPLTWVTEITHVREHEMFVDEQRHGPYRMWHHQHLFRAIEDGTEVEDIVDYVVGFGPLGPIANRILIARQVAGIFEHRARILEELFGLAC